MSCDENDGNRKARIGKLRLEIEAAQSGQPDIKHQAARNRREARLQQVRCGFKQLDLLADRHEEAADRSPYDWIVIDDEDDRIL